MLSSAASRTPVGLERYVRIVDDRVGHGSYGQVYKARDILTGRTVALKCMRAEDGDLPAVLLREIATLKAIKGHDALVQLLDVFPNPRSHEIFLVFELMASDLKKFLQTAHRARRAKAAQGLPMPEPGPSLRESLVPLAQFKFWAWQLLTGLAYCHARGIIHRDIKPANCLLDAEARILKLADFGLARSMTAPLRRYTHEVVTLWYRPPEILLGSTHYTSSVDVWSAGCLLVECITGTPPFNGNVEIEQLFKIFRVLGTPSPAAWPELESLPEWNEGTFPAWPRRSIRALIGDALPAEGVDLIERMLQYNPDHRMPVAEAIRHPFFAEFHARPAAPAAAGGAAAAGAARGARGSLVSELSTPRHYDEPGTWTNSRMSGVSTADPMERRSHVGLSMDDAPPVESTSALALARIRWANRTGQYQPGQAEEAPARLAGLQEEDVEEDLDILPITDDVHLPGATSPGTKRKRNEQ